jgi:hypothetical protein
MGVAWSGGPLYADAFGAKRGPSPWQLVESYKQIAFACTEFNALGVSALPLRLYAASGAAKAKPRPSSGPRSVRRLEVERLLSLRYVRRQFGSPKDVEDVHEITTHPLLDALDHPAIDPDTGMSYFDRPGLIATLVRYLDIVGIAYLKPEDENGRDYAQLVASQTPPPLLWPLQAQYVWPVRKENSALIKSFKYFAVDYEPDQLMMIRLRASLRDPYGAGYAAAQAAWQYSGLEDKGISMWDQLIGRGSRPNVIWTPADPNLAGGEDERRRFSQELHTFQSGGRGGDHIVTNGAYQPHAMTYQGFDMGEMSQNTYNMERMCNCWGVPVSFMSSETNLANFQAGRTFHAQFGLEPRAQCIASSLSDLARRYDERLFFAFDGAIGEDKEINAKIIDMKVKAGIMTGNEANAEEPWTPKPWLDEPWIPGTLVQPTMAQERHEQGLETAQAQAKAAKDGNKGAGPGGRPGGNGRRPAGKRGVGGSESAEAAEAAILERAERVLRKIEREMG